MIPGCASACCHDASALPCTAHAPRETSQAIHHWRQPPSMRWCACFARLLTSLAGCKPLHGNWETPGRPHNCAAALYRRIVAIGGRAIPCAELPERILSPLPQAMHPTWPPSLVCTLRRCGASSGALAALCSNRCLRHVPAPLAANEPCPSTCTTPAIFASAQCRLQQGGTSPPAALPYQLLSSKSVCECDKERGHPIITWRPPRHPPLPHARHHQRPLHPCPVTPP